MPNWTLYLLISHPDNVVTWECWECAAVPTEYDDTHHWKPIELQVFCVAQEFPVITPTYVTWYEVLSTAAARNVASWHVTQCRLIKLFLKIQRNLLVPSSGYRKKKFLYPKDEDSKLPRNVVNVLQDGTESHGRHNNIHVPFHAWQDTTNNLLPPSTKQAY